MFFYRAERRFFRMSKCICSVAIDSSDWVEIPSTENPGRAKSLAVKRRRILFYDDETGKHKIPEGSERVCFPRYERHMHNVFYGAPRYE
jgi:hypothetical protein